VKLTHLHLVPRSNNEWSYTSTSPNTPQWRGAQLKHRDSFTFVGPMSPEEEMTTGPISVARQTASADTYILDDILHSGV
jgi:hypothetical protein